MFSKFAARRRGFTLIELMIVIIVIAILALIVIPKLAGASKKAKESSMVSNLGILRNALEQFQADTGTYPTVLNDLGAPSSSPPSLPTGYSIATSYKGPYLRAQGGLGSNDAIPRNPFKTSTADGMAEKVGTAGIAAASDTAASVEHWIYDKDSGKVWPNTGGTTEDGKAYLDL